MNTDSHLTVVAEMKAQPGREDLLRQALVGLVEPTRREEGCLSYDLHLAPEDPSVFLFYETWTDREALDRHLQTEHLKAFRAKAPELLQGEMKLSFWKQVLLPA